MSTKPKPTKSPVQTQLEKEYLNVFGENKAPIKENKSLDQQSPYLTVRTYTTYGAYEEPI